VCMWMEGGVRCGRRQLAPWPCALLATICVLLCCPVYQGVCLFEWALQALVLVPSLPCHCCATRVTADGCCLSLRATQHTPWEVSPTSWCTRCVHVVPRSPRYLGRWVGWLKQARVHWCTPPAYVANPLAHNCSPTWPVACLLTLLCPGSVVHCRRRPPPHWHYTGGCAVSNYSVPQSTHVFPAGQ
jgi:hypothetical protein